MFQSFPFCCFFFRSHIQFLNIISNFMVALNVVSAKVHQPKLLLFLYIIYSNNKENCYTSFWKTSSKLLKWSLNIFLNQIRSSRYVMQVFHDSSLSTPFIYLANLAAAFHRWKGLTVNCHNLASSVNAIFL